MSTDVNRAGKPPEVARLAPATICGLILALLVPLLPLLFNSDYQNVVPMRAQILGGLAIHWLNLVALLVLIRFWERRGPASIGFRQIRWFTPVLGILAGVLITAASGVLVSALHLNASQKFADHLAGLPIGLRLALVLTAGIFEETLFRGYALERLAVLMRSRWLAAATTWGLFVAAHAPAVGWTFLPPIAVVSAFITVLYVWKRDLVLNMVAHSTVDAIGLLVAPLLAQAGSGE